MTKQNKISSALYLIVMISTLSFVSINTIAAERNGQHRNTVDTNEDGAVDLNEMIAAATAKAEQHFSNKDTDSDGFVSFEEYTASGRGAVDLTLYAEEIVQCVSDLKEELGSDTIQVPSEDQFTSPEDKFNAVDTNGDAAIDLTEAIEKATENATNKFALLDADNDGLVTKEEKRTHHASHKGTRRAIKKCIAEVTSEESSGEF